MKKFLIIVGSAIAACAVFLFGTVIAINFIAPDEKIWIPDLDGISDDDGSYESGCC